MPPVPLMVGDAPSRRALSLKRPSPLVALSVLTVLAGTTLTGEQSQQAIQQQETTAAESIKKLQQGAEQGNAEAQYRLGWAYANGRGVPQDVTQAVQWYHKAADQGLAAAQFNLGVMYDNGQGVPKDPAQAVQWYHKAANQGLAVAQHNLGEMYAAGRGVPQDYAEAYKWFNLASAAASGRSQKKFAEERDLVAKKMTPAQLAEAQKRTREWTEAFDRPRKK